MIGRCRVGERRRKTEWSRSEDRWKDRNWIWSFCQEVVLCRATDPLLAGKSAAKIGPSDGVLCTSAIVPLSLSRWPSYLLGTDKSIPCAIGTRVTKKRFVPMPATRHEPDNEVEIGKF